MGMFKFLLLLLAFSSCGNARADEVKMDGKWRGSAGAALSISSGNTKSASLNLTANAARQTTVNKLSLYLQALGSRAESTNNGVTSTNTTANQWMAGTRYDHNLSYRIFGFGGLDFNHDQIKLLSLRSVVSGGLGYHVIKTADNQWDFLAGLAYRTDKYNEPGVSMDNAMRTRVHATELLLGEESNHRLSDSTSFKQKLMISPTLSGIKGTRATFDAGLQVALNNTMNLTMTLQERYDSFVQSPVRKNDILFFTGINVKFGS